MRWWRKKSELDAEIEAHIRMAVADRVARGEDAAGARIAAEREFGNAALVKDVTREAWGWMRLERLLQDARYALRQLRKSPTFAVTVIATLALGIAAPAAMFTVVDRVMLRPLPYKDAGRLMQISLKQIDLGRWREPAYLDVKEWQRWNKSFDEIAFYHLGLGRSFLEGTTGTKQVSWFQVSSNLFSVLGAVPEIGRDFRNSGDSFAKGTDAASVVLSDAAWRSMFGADPSVLGKTVKISGKPFVIVGVMPRGFSFPYMATGLQVWTPVDLGEQDKGRTNDTPGYSVIGRLRNGVSMERAQAELSSLQKQVAMGYVDPEARRQASDVAIKKYSDTLVETDTKRALLMLLAASGVLWLIACVNTTNLLLARAMSRQREVAVRGALGAGRARIMQQFLVEGLLLSAVGSIAGLGLALLAVKLFAYSIRHALSMPVEVTPDMRMLAGLFGLTLVSAIVSSIWPAWMSAHAPVEPALRQGGVQAGTARRHNRMRGILVMVEIALSLTLLTGCGLLLRTIYALRHVPLGFRTDHIIVVNLEIPGYKFAGKDMGQNLYLPLAERIRHMPGVQAAGLMSEVPLGKTFWVQLGMQAKPGQKMTLAKLQAASPALQKIFGFRMLAGRYFDESDTPASIPAIVVNRAFVRENWPEIQDMRQAIGKELFSPKKDSKQQVQVIGVLDDFKQFSASANPSPEIEMSLTQLTPESSHYQILESIAMDIALRTERDPKEMIPELREVLRQADPALAGSNFTTMDQVVEDSFGSQKLAAHLLEIFGGSALLLCVAGLYGLLAYIVSQRTRELGVRLALGAQRGDLLWLVLRQAGGMLVTGVVIGLGLALASGRLVHSYLYGVTARDGWTLTLVAVTLFLCGLLAAYLPARRAAHVDPMEALRAE